MYKTLKNSVTPVIFFSAFLIVTWFVSQYLVSNNGFGFRFRGEEVDLVFFLLVASFTLLGLILGVFYQDLRYERANKLPWWSIIGISFSSVKFGLALLISPIIVLLVFAQIYDQDYNFPVFVFCVQNGFFWERTLSAISYVQIEIINGDKIITGDITNSKSLAFGRDAQSNISDTIVESETEHKDALP